MVKLVLSLLLILLVSLPIGLTFFWSVGFGEIIKRRVELALKRDGLQAQIERLSFSPFQGFIAKNTVLKSARVCIHAQRLTFSFSISQFLWGKILINEVQLDGASLDVSPLNEMESHLSIQDLSARMLLQSHYLRLSIAEFTFGNIRFVVSGSIRNPLLQPLASTLKRQPDWTNWKMIERIVRELGKIRYLDKPAQVDIVVEGDPIAFQTFRAHKITLHAKNIQYCSIFLREMELGARCTNGVLEIYKLYMRDTEGNLDGSGTVDFLASEGKFAISSSLNLQPFFTEFFPRNRLQKLVVHKLQTGASSQIDLTTHLSWKGDHLRYKVLGSAAVCKFFYGKSFLQRLELGFLFEDRQWFIQDLSIQCRSGVLRADVRKIKELLQIRLGSTLNPKEFSDLFGLKVRKLLDQTQFLDSPRLTLRLSGRTLDFLHGQGELSIGRTAVRGAWADYGSSKIEISPQSVTCRDFEVRCKRGRGSGTLSYNFGKGQIQLYNVVSTLMPQDVMLWISPQLAQVVSPYRFRSPPIVQVDGCLYPSDPQLNALSVQIYSRSGLDYDLFGRTLCFGPTRATVCIEGTQVKIRIPSAALFQGSIALQASIHPDTLPPTFELDVRLSHIECSRLTELFFGYTRSNGFLTGNYRFRACTDREEGMLGSGYIRIEEGSVLSIPFLRPLSIILNQIIPGIGYEPARKACVAFQVENRKVSTKNLQIAGPGFNLLGCGDVDFFTGKMNMTVRVNAQGVPGMVLLPVSKLLEFESRGTLSRPDWRLKRLKPLIQF
ncbi:AsmA family protein [Candidatus Xiphinematobacter sp. Idaho Grape]|nr:AsmA family protein [Candidatus Xiphinematobacter sp. Idaho Grape]